VIVGAAVAGIILRPRRVPSWATPVAGAAIVVALGYESFPGAIAAIAAQWNVLLFIAGLMGLSLAAERSGAVDWFAGALSAAARGSCRRLFVLLFLGGAVVTCILSNDATAIVFTPIVYRTVANLKLDVRPFLLGCTFVADTASFGLPFSNPANVLVLPRPDVAAYVWHLGPPQLAAIAINLAIFMVVFRSALRGRFEEEAYHPPSAAAIRVTVVLALLVAAYVLALACGWPLGPVAAIAALAALALAGRSSPLEYPAQWGTFALLAGLFVLFDALARSGIVAWVSRELAAAAAYGRLAEIGTAAAGAALFSNVLNNLPVAVASSLAVANHGAAGVAYPLIAGIDLGPNLTLAGSLATILWAAALRQRDVRVDALEYARLGVLTVPPMLLGCVLWLWLVG